MTTGVFEYVVDSATSAPSGPMDCLVAGVCSTGSAGQPYLISNRSDINGLLGVGPMVDRIHDIFLEDTGELGRNINLVVVPVTPGTLGALPSPLSASAGGSAVTLSGSQTNGLKLVVKIENGGLKEGSSGDIGQFNYSIDGGHNYESEDPITMPASGFLIPDSGVTIHFDEASTAYVKGETYSGIVEPPTAAVADVITTINPVLETYDVRRIFITGPSDRVDWASMGTLADDLFSRHRPVSIVAEFRGLNIGETYNNWATQSTSGVIDQRSLYDHPYVDVVAAEGDVICKDYKTRRKVLAGLYMGRTLSIKTNRHIGRVRSGPVNGLINVSPDYMALQETLENAGLITVTNFAGLSGFFWGDDRTLAGSGSNYRSVRPRETVFKALRIARSVALQYIRDEAGNLSGSTGLSALRSDIENAIYNAMVGPASEQEMKSITVTIPPGQDPEVGIDVELDFFGIPAIQKISLYANYSTAGASLSEAA